jgi:hypothetical protein
MGGGESESVEVPLRQAVGGSGQLRHLVATRGNCWMAIHSQRYVQLCIRPNNYKCEGVRSLIQMIKIIRCLLYFWGKGTLEFGGVSVLWKFSEIIVFSECRSSIQTARPWEFPSTQHIYHDCGSSRVCTTATRHRSVLTRSKAHTPH